MELGSKIELAAAQDQVRPILNTVWYDGEGSAWACDGFILARVPVDAESGAELKIETDLIKQVRKSSSRSVELTAKDDGSIVLKSGKFTSFQESQIESQYPDVNAILEGPKENTGQSVALNAELLVRLQRAMGAEGVVLTLGSDDTYSVYVTPANDDTNKAEGVIMPMWRSKR